MKAKTSELIYEALDWAVTHANYEINGDEVWRQDKCDYSTDWAWGGPIIEREGISIGCHLDGAEWFAQNYWGEYESSGPTALIAAMRCFVASRFGDEIDIPEDLRILAQAEQLQHVKDLEDFDPMEKFVFDPNQEPMQLRQPQSLGIAEQLTKTK